MIWLRNWTDYSWYPIQNFEEAKNKSKANAIINDQDDTFNRNNRPNCTEKLYKYVKNKVTNIWDITSLCIFQRQLFTVAELV